jgi:peptidyl-prolyl cis-trans isomerase D
MITWMQQHNRYLVWTIWVATIAFIGAGFVGWGSYQFGSKGSTIAKVGEVEIEKSKLDMAYNSLYQRYNQIMQGKLDDEKAREFGLLQQAFGSLVTQAQLLNLANRFGIIVSDEELALKVTSIPDFQTDGRFDKQIYDTYLKSQRLSVPAFEHILREDLIIEKLLGLLRTPALPLEQEAFSSAFGISDSISYRVLTVHDVNVTMDEAAIRTFWERDKKSYMTSKRYTLDIVWTDTDDVNVTEEQIATFYSENSFNYIDDEGKQLELDDARQRVSADLKLKQAKKEAQKSYIAFKKDRRNASETLTLDLHALPFDGEVWEEILMHDIDDILKPKVVGDHYATIKIAAIDLPREKTFEEARAEATDRYRAEATQEALDKLAKEQLENPDTVHEMLAENVTLDNPQAMTLLEPSEATQFARQLFTSDAKKGIIEVGSKVVIYRIAEQAIGVALPQERLETIRKSLEQTKESDLQSNLIKQLDTQYPVKTYAEGLL